MIRHKKSIVLYYTFVLRFILKVNKYNVYMAEMTISRVSSRLRQVLKDKGASAPLFISRLKLTLL
ncbi:hypothetical protein PKF032_08290 [Polynucleobacter yangtzensis]|uniref:Uncharacterized protein n=1 Tax=Polynucleobacter yangtzensis TaxID=1743159 RepID=A0ABN6TT94_9BURK|nr:hypothetical protein PKF032_08290 [Polynucleobacter yangtzensis]